MVLSVFKNIKHPISVARKVMDNTPHVMLSGEGAFEFAIKNGFHKEDLLTEKAKIRWKEWLRDSKYQPIINVENHDTIGLLAIDKKEISPELVPLQDLLGKCMDEWGIPQLLAQECLLTMKLEGVVLLELGKLS